MKCGKLVCLLAVAAVACSAITARAGEKHIKHLTITLALADNSALAEAGFMFCELIEKRTNGRYTAEAFPNSILAGGNQATAIEMVQKGSIDMGLPGNLVCSNYIPELLAICLPWLWKDYAAVDATLDVKSKVGQYLIKAAEGKNLYLLGFMENGYRELSNNVRPVRSPDDMSGLKLRIVGNTMLLDVFNALGANPTDFNFNELYTGLQQGAVDGQENPVTNVFVPSKYYEVQKYLTVWKYMYEPMPAIINLKLWQSMSAEDRKILQECMDEAIAYQRKISRERLAADTDFVKDYGVEVVELTDAEIEAFKVKAMPAIEKHKKNYDPVFIELLYDANK